MHKTKRDCFALWGSGGRDKDPGWYRKRTPWLLGSRESTGKIWGEVDKLKDMLHLNISKSCGREERYWEINKQVDRQYWELQRE